MMEVLGGRIYWEGVGLLGHLGNPNPFHLSFPSNSQEVGSLHHMLPTLHLSLSEPGAGRQWAELSSTPFS